MKSIKIYELYDWFGQIQSGQTNYKHDAKVLHVAAKSVKQAYYLAGNSVWFGSNEDETGIVEKRIDPDCIQPWLFFDKSRHRCAQFEHGDACKRRLKRLVAENASTTTTC